MTTHGTTHDINDVAAKARRTLIPLLVIYLLGTVCLQAFNLVFQHIGADLGAPDQASLITAIPGVVLGIVCFIYGSLGDFLSLKRITLFGLALLCAGSVLGFLLHGSLPLVIGFRIIQTIGFQAAGSAYLVIVAKYLKPEEKLLYFGLFTADYQLATAIGVLSGGLFVSIDWSYLFLIPLLSLLVLVPLVRDLPSSRGGHGNVDVPGFAIFGVAVLMLTLFFSMLQWWMIVASLAFFILFAIYISRAKDPFITPDFFHNARWIKSIMLIVIFYFINFSITPLVNAFGSEVYGMTSSQISLMLLPALILATISGTCSGRIAKAIGREHAILTGGTLMGLGMLGGAFCLGLGPVAVAVTMCLFYGGMAMLYSPTVDTVLGTLTPEQSGRGVGLNDLAMQGAGSIGIAVFGGPIVTQPFASGSLIGATGAAANASNLLLIYAAIMVFGVVWFLVFRKAIAGKR
ncbi:MFS transporter [Bifidobacterium vansinderenii]|uniref:MFS, tetracycline-resistance protein n=1 Tax=Bifidobacterium vansinderenii TaxID=1984871 RepID=A0A229VV82_9BIFI|nr:MFS transporter [Bifidobacterium vansinderenii]OXM99520.1 MFS, tetracycline-resistance protein [Bifidobacterium vansinderenii]